MKILVVSFIALFAVGKATGQKIADYVRTGSVAIRTNSPDSTDFSDLETIGAAIGDARVLMLGEQDHGDAPAFLAKTRLIKYLHEKKGFDVLAFESDFFALNTGLDSLRRSGADQTGFIRENVFPIWTRCDGCRPLFNDLIPNAAATPRPILVTGFDNQTVGLYSAKNLSRKIDEVFRLHNLPMVSLRDYPAFLTMIDSLPFKYTGNAKDLDLESLKASLLKAESQLEAKLPPEDFWNLLIDNLIAQCDEYKNIGGSHAQRTIPRDRQMAANLNWLVNKKFAGKKIIVWAANFHIGKFSGDFNNSGGDKPLTMGGFFTSDSSDAAQTYVMGFTSFEGTAGRFGQKIFEVAPPGKNGFERWIPERFDFAFTDFKTYRKQAGIHAERFFAKGLRHQNMKANWTDVYDGMFFVRRMYPCARP